MKNVLTIFALATALTGTTALACGAIAYNPNTNSWGRATGYNNLGDAMSNAISNCNNGCGIYAWTCSNEVTAIVYQGSTWATSTGNDADQAVANARAICPSCSGYVTAGSN